MKISHKIIMNIDDFRKKHGEVSIVNRIKFANNAKYCFNVACMHNYVDIASGVGCHK